MIATRGAWRRQVRVGDVILVCDVGGGTTDLSLIAVSEEKGHLALTRLAVGDHILLGGDNMDLALAHGVAVKLKAQGEQLDRWQMNSLTHACRGAKEALLSVTEVSAAPVVVASRGAQLVGSSLRTELTGDEVKRTLVEGFFPEVDASARPATRARSALSHLGLPYAADAGITRHLAAFLRQQAGATKNGPRVVRSLPRLGNRRRALAAGCQQGRASDISPC